MIKTPLWDEARVAALATREIEALLANARRKGADGIVEVCQAELGRRKATYSPRIKREASHSEDYVAGYHFVCALDRGVTVMPDGTFTSGSWKVARSEVEKSLRFGAYIALHEKKDLNSYRQGKIIDFRVADRDMIDKENLGIEFFARSTFESKMWAGGGAGEKGYLWVPTNKAITDKNGVKD